MMELNFNGQTAIVTGASRGIGKAIAELLLKAGCSVIITSTAKTAPKWCKSYPSCSHKTVDFLRSQSLSHFLKEMDKLPKIDILVNNAGIHIPEPIYSIKEMSLKKILGVNLYAPILIMNHICQKMAKAKKGRILNISSMAGIVSKPKSSIYSSAKSGLLGLTRASALDMAEYNVLVNCLCPGHTDTDMTKRLLTNKTRQNYRKMIPLARFARPTEIADMAIFLCSNLNTYITGQTIIVDGGACVQ